MMERPTIDPTTKLKIVTPAPDRELVSKVHGSARHVGYKEVVHRDVSNDVDLTRGHSMQQRYDRLHLGARG